MNYEYLHSRDELSVTLERIYNYKMMSIREKEPQCTAYKSTATWAWYVVCPVVSVVYCCLRLRLSS